MLLTKIDQVRTLKRRPYLVNWQYQVWIMPYHRLTARDTN
jgi:hypothetical protein